MIAAVPTHSHPSLFACRTASLAERLADGDDMAQVQAAGAARLAEWRSRGDISALAAELAAMDAKLPVNAAEFGTRLAPWVSDSGAEDLSATGLGWVRSFLDMACAAMANDPLAALPWRMQPGDLVQGIALIEGGGGSAMIAVVSADAVAQQSRASADRRPLFDCGYSLIHLLSGSLHIRRYSLSADRTRLAMADPPDDLWLSPGDQLLLDHRQQQIVIIAAPRDAVILRLAVAGQKRDEPAREFDGGTGALTRTGCADPVVSRMLALIALASQGQQADVVPLLARLTNDADAGLRWQAMRHLLALDLMAGAPLLAKMAAGDADVGVRDVARATGAIIERLQQDQPCPAT